MRGALASWVAAAHHSLDSLSSQLMPAGALALGCSCVAAGSVADAVSDAAASRAAMACAREKPALIIS